MSRDWLAYFKAKRGMGAVICEGPEIEAACAEIEALLARHNALREAVAWERETYMFWEFGRTDTLMANDEALESMFAARSEVDRLIGEGQ